VSVPKLDALEQRMFDKILLKIQQQLSGWNEEDLKMKFISPLLYLSNLVEDDSIALGYFDKTISATVDKIKLVVKSDFMLAKGILDVVGTPYFHFQKYKPYKNPTGDSMA
jgi:hypothetical protein